MLIKKLKHQQPHTPTGGGMAEQKPTIKKQQYTTTPKKHTNHTPTNPSGFILS
jgi:hypothetical protein